MHNIHHNGLFRQGNNTELMNNLQELSLAFQTAPSLKAKQFGGRSWTFLSGNHGMTFKDNGHDICVLYLAKHPVNTKRVDIV